MKSPEYIETKLSNRTNANASEYEVKNNRYHYLLTFNESIGWDWLLGQVMKTRHVLDTEIELWEIHPGNDTFIVEVREVERREGIDNSQSGLGDFE